MAHKLLELSGSQLTLSKLKVSQSSRCDVVVEKLEIFFDKIIATFLCCSGDIFNSFEKELTDDHPRVRVSVYAHTVAYSMTILRRLNARFQR